jgi:hypothetical protein
MLVRQECLDAAMLAYHAEASSWRTVGEAPCVVSPAIRIEGDINDKGAHAGLSFDTTDAALHFIVCSAVHAALQAAAPYIMADILIRGMIPEVRGAMAEILKGI